MHRVVKGKGLSSFLEDSASGLNILPPQRPDALALTLITDGLRISVIVFLVQISTSLVKHLQGLYVLVGGISDHFCLAALQLRAVLLLTFSPECGGEDPGKVSFG